MRKRVGRIFWLLIVIVWVATVGAWLRTRFRADVVGIVLRGTYVEFQSIDDGLAVRVMRRWPAGSHSFWSAGPRVLTAKDGSSATDEDVPPRGPSYSIGAFGPPPPRWMQLTGIHFVRVETAVVMTGENPPRPRMDVPRRWGWVDEAPYSPPLPESRLYIRPWMLPGPASTVLIIALMAAGGSALRRRRRRARGLCIRCGYDLRQTPGRCPECGATV